MARCSLCSLNWEAILPLSLPKENVPRVLSAEASFTEIWLAARTPEGEANTDWCYSLIILGKWLQESWFLAGKGPQVYTPGDTASVNPASRKSMSHRSGNGTRCLSFCSLLLVVWRNRAVHTFIHSKPHFTTCLSLWKTPSSQYGTQGTLIIWETHWKNLHLQF